MNHIPQSARRRVLRAAAWSAPAVAAASMAPAASASVVRAPDMIGTSVQITEANGHVLLGLPQGVYGYNLDGGPMTLSSATLTFWFAAPSLTITPSNASGDPQANAEWTDATATGATMTVDGVTLYAYQTAYTGPAVTADTLTQTTPVMFSIINGVALVSSGSPAQLDLSGTVNGATLTGSGTGTRTTGTYIDVNAVS